MERGEGEVEGPGALLTDAKTPGIVAKVKQTTVAVAGFRSALAHERKLSSELLFCRSRCGIIVPIQHYRRAELDEIATSSSRPILVRESGSSKV